MTKIFISLPMRGITTDAIRDEMDRIKSIFEPSIDDTIEIIDTVFEEDIPEDCAQPSIYYLTKSLAKLAEADLVIFHPLWRHAAGCMIEHAICAMYNIPYFDLTDTFLDDDSQE